jgi:transposase InsO family protein
MVERFNGRISEVLATNRFQDGEDLRSAITRYVWLYNHQLPQKALGYQAPIAALKRWYAEKPDLFQRKPGDRQGLDTYSAPPVP